MDSARGPHPFGHAEHCGVDDPMDLQVGLSASLLLLWIKLPDAQEFFLHAGLLHGLPTQTLTGFCEVHVFRLSGRIIGHS